MLSGKYIVKGSTFFNCSNINIIVTDHWYGPLKMILPEPEAREISISWSVPRPEGSLYILILSSISVTIVFIELKTHKI
jgi:hypothetical protein